MATQDQGQRKFTVDTSELKARGSLVPMQGLSDAVVDNHVSLHKYKVSLENYGNNE